MKKIKKSKAASEDRFQTALKMEERVSLKESLFGLDQEFSIIHNGRGYLKAQKL